MFLIFPYVVNGWSPNSNKTHYHEGSWLNENFPQYMVPYSAFSNLRMLIGLPLNISDETKIKQKTKYQNEIVMKVCMQNKYLLLESET